MLRSLPSSSTWSKTDRPFILRQWDTSTPAAQRLQAAKKGSTWKEHSTRCRRSWTASQESGQLIAPGCEISTHKARGGKAAQTRSPK